jgi:Phosphotransferase enzyme family
VSKTRTSPYRRAIEEQIEQVDRRVTGSAYSGEAAEIRRAVENVPRLRDRLGLVKFHGSLNPGSGKPQLLLGFWSAEHGDVVLKVYGRQRPNESAVQAMWHSAGVPAVPVLCAGDDPVSWLLMPRVPGQQPCPEAGPELTGHLAGVLRAAHAVYSPGVGEPRDLVAGVGGHLRGVLAAAERHGYPLPGGWESAAVKYYQAGAGTFLHGDMTVLNLLQDDAGRLLLLDTCGYTGPAEFDAARWSARTGGAAEAADLLAVWCRNEPELDRRLAKRLLGLELLMEAGVREIIKEERGTDWTVTDAETQRLFSVGSELLR